MGVGVSICVYIHSFRRVSGIPSLIHCNTKALIHCYPVLNNLRLMLYTSARIVKAKATSTRAY